MLESSRPTGLRLGGARESTALAVLCGQSPTKPVQRYQGAEESRFHYLGSWTRVVFASTVIRIEILPLLVGKCLKLIGTCVIHIICGYSAIRRAEKD